VGYRDRFVVFGGKGMGSKEPNVCEHGVLK
jgi:hypothetical protein